MTDPSFRTGTEGRNRTGMDISPEDFESSASTNFTTPAFGMISVRYSDMGSFVAVLARARKFRATVDTSWWSPDHSGPILWLFQMVKPR